MKPAPQVQDDPAQPSPCGLARPAAARRAALAVLAAMPALALGAAGHAVVANAGPGAGAGNAWPSPAPALRRGVNLSHWFEYERGRHVAPGELRALRRLGFDHVRIPVDPVTGGWQAGSGGPLAFQRELEEAVAAALAADLGVVVDLHLTPEAKARIEGRHDAEDAIGALWLRLGRALAATPRDRVAFEIFNEPQFYGALAARWPRLQRTWLSTLRSVLPEHLLVLTAAQGGSLEALLASTPEPDPNVAYAFHRYEPFLFTHQGAHWLDERYTTAGLHSGLRYPAVQQAGVAPRLAHAHPHAAQELGDYLSTGDAQHLRAAIDRAGTWARAHRVRLLCNEFGVIRPGVDPASRWRWLADMRIALEANAIGWTVWDYADLFGITQASPDGREVEPGAIAALGLGALHAEAGSRP